jgi:hypothetical protein
VSGEDDDDEEEEEEEREAAEQLFRKTLKEGGSISGVSKKLAPPLLILLPPPSPPTLLLLTHKPMYLPREKHQFCKSFLSVFANICASRAACKTTNVDLHIFSSSSSHSASSSTTNTITTTLAHIQTHLISEEEKNQILQIFFVVVANICESRAACKTKNLDHHQYHHQPPRHSPPPHHHHQSLNFPWLPPPPKNSPTHSKTTQHLLIKQISCYVSFPTINNTILALFPWNPLAQVNKFAPTLVQICFVANHQHHHHHHHHSFIYSFNHSAILQP